MQDKLFKTYNACARDIYFSLTRTALTSDVHLMIMRIFLEDYKRAHNHAARERALRDLSVFLVKNVRIAQPDMNKAREIIQKHLFPS